MSSAHIYTPRPQGTLVYPPFSENSLQNSSLHPSYPLPHEASEDGRANAESRTGVDYRGIARTPSPTPSEAEALVTKTGSINYKKYLDASYLKDRKNLVSIAVTLLILGLVIAFIVEQNNIVKALRPVAKWMHKTPGGWLIPIAVMIVLSFPPLFGHEIVALLCGDVWGLGIGFLIVAAGTLLGELVTYYTFRYCCKARGAKTEQKNLRFGLLSEVIRQGGYRMAIIVRYSAIPGHLTTAVFATCGMRVLTFLVAAVLSLPKQLATVYLGTSKVDANGDPQPSSTQKTVKIIVIAITTVVTIGAMRYVNARIDSVKHAVIYQRRKVRQVRVPLPGDSASSASLAYSSYSSSSFSYGYKPPTRALGDGTEDVGPFAPRAGAPAQQARVGAGPTGTGTGVYAPTPAHTLLGQQQAPAVGAPPRSPGYDLSEARYDDAYDGRDALSTGGLRTPAATSAS